MELIDVTKRDIPGVFLINALAKAEGVSEVIATGPTPVCEVELTINGVSVPVAATLEDMWNRAIADLNERAKKMAYEMVSEAALDPLREALQEADWRIKEALDKLPER